MNSISVGFGREVKPPPGGSLLIQDEADVPAKFRPKIFDPTKHSFNPLEEINERKAQELAELIYTVYPQGENTLTVRNGKWDLAPALLKAKSLDEVTGKEEVTGVMGDLLFNPVVRNCLCRDGFQFDKSRLIVARLNRAEIGDKAALTIGLFLIASYPGAARHSRLRLLRPRGAYQSHSSEPLIAGVNALEELSAKLRQAVS